LLLLIAPSCCHTAGLPLSRAFWHGQGTSNALRMALARVASIGESGDGADVAIMGRQTRLPCLRGPPARAIVRTAICGVNEVNVESARMNMKKRIRKKFRVGEYTRWGCSMAVFFADGHELDEFLDVFLPPLEAGGMTCMLGGDDVCVTIVVALGKASDVQEARLAELKRWLDGCSFVKRFEAEPIVELGW
jgi:uncharacterized protein YggL (DUF469 family)